MTSANTVDARRARPRTPRDAFSTRAKKVSNFLRVALDKVLTRGRAVRVRLSSYEALQLDHEISRKLF